MKQQIQNLMQRAGTDVSGKWMSVDNAEKFAELIVRECARIAAQTPFPDADEDIRKTFGHTWDMACVKSAKDIRKHFGVEE